MSEHFADTAHERLPTLEGLGHVQLHLVESVDDAAELMRWLSNVERLALDTECTGLNIQRDKVRLVQVGDTHHGWAIPWERWGGVVEEIVRKWTGPYVLHNMPYDWAMLNNSCGITLPRVKCDDTRVASHVLHPDRSTALKSLAAYYIDPMAAALSKQLDDVMKQRGGWTWETVPVTFEPYWSYGALDAVLTAHLDKKVMPHVMAEAPLAYQLECAALWVTLDMSQRGARIDREFTQQKYTEFLQYVQSVQDWCIANYGVKPGANADVIRKLQEFGFEFTKETASGAISLDKEVIGGIDHPLAQAVLGRRQVQKIASTYLKNFLVLSDDEDLLHPRINTLGFQEAKDFGVITGRMSMDTPNLQNLSRTATGNTPANAVRKCIVSRPGHTLLMVDFDQIEARLIAHLTRDPGFIAAFAEGDFFLNITKALWGDESIVKADPRRQSSKNAIYARAYGAGAPKFARTAGIPEQAAYTMYARLDQLYPGWKAFTQELERVARERIDTEGSPYVKSFMTGRRHVAPEGKLYVLVNYLIQGTAAEIFKMKLVELAQAGMDAYMILPVHDEVLMDVPNELFADAVNSTLPIMNDSTLLTVPLTASGSKGQRWGEKTDLL